MLVHNSVPACCALVVSFLSDTSCFLVSYIFLSWKVCFWSHEFDSGPSDIFSHFCPWLFPIDPHQLYMLSLLEFLSDELKLCGQIILVPEFDRKAGLLSGLYSCVFSRFSAAYCSFNTKEKVSSEPESNRGPKDVFVHYSPPLYQLSYRQDYRRSVW